MSYGIPIFFCEPTGDMLVHVSADCACGEFLRHDLGRVRGLDLPPFPQSWPGAPCGKCGRADPEIKSQGGRRIFRRLDTGQELGASTDLPPGAVYEAREFRKGADGRSLVAVLPNGQHWHIDSRASNCTMPDDDAHRCWVRHGRPEDGTLHVDKKGHTCAAGAGSIVIGDWHGFLHNGRLVQC